MKLTKKKKMITNRMFEHKRAYYDRKMALSSKKNHPLSRNDRSILENINE